MDNRTTAAAMRRLNGQFATPLGMSDTARELETRGLMKFREWPSGHWSITESGQRFLSEVCHG